MTATETVNLPGEVVRLSGAATSTSPTGTGWLGADTIFTTGAPLLKPPAGSPARGCATGGLLQAIVPAYLTGSATPHDLHARWLGPLAGLASAAGINLRPIPLGAGSIRFSSAPLGDLADVEDVVLHRGLRKPGADGRG